mgnify:CR=1 FL=1
MYEIVSMLTNEYDDNGDVDDDDDNGDDDGR